MVGFTKDFFDEYHKIHPRSEPHYEERQVLYELWHHLNVSSSGPWDDVGLTDSTH